jgi:PAS domain-containing protein
VRSYHPASFPALGLVLSPEVLTPNPDRLLPYSRCPSCAAPIFGVDTKGFVNEWNQKAEAITGYSRNETMGQNFVQKFIAPDWKKPVNEVRQMIPRARC